MSSTPTKGAGRAWMRSKKPDSPQPGGLASSTTSSGSEYVAPKQGGLRKPTKAPSVLVEPKTEDSVAAVTSGIASLPAGATALGGVASSGDFVLPPPVTGPAAAEIVLPPSVLPAATVTSLGGTSAGVTLPPPVSSGVPLPTATPPFNPLVANAPAPVTVNPLPPAIPTAVPPPASSSVVFPPASVSLQAASLPPLPADPSALQQTNPAAMLAGAQAPGGAMTSFPPPTTGAGLTFDPSVPPPNFPGPGPRMGGQSNGGGGRAILGARPILGMGAKKSPETIVPPPAADLGSMVRQNSLTKAREIAQVSTLSANAAVFVPQPSRFQAEYLSVVQTMEKGATSLRHLLGEMTVDPAAVDNMGPRVLALLREGEPQMVAGVDAIVNQGIQHQNFHYTAARLCAFCDQEFHKTEVGTGFRSVLFKRLREEHGRCEGYAKDPEHHGRLVSFTTLLAEIFINILSIHGERFVIVRKVLYDLLRLVAVVNTDDSLRAAVMVLKLCGRDMEQDERSSEGHASSMDQTMAQLTNALGAPGISSSIARSFKNVADLRAKGWSYGDVDTANTAPLQPQYQTLEPTYYNVPGGGGGMQQWPEAEYEMYDYPEDPELGMYMGPDGGPQWSAGGDGVEALAEGRTYAYGAQGGPQLDALQELRNQGIGIIDPGDDGDDIAASFEDFLKESGQA